MEGADAGRLREPLLGGAGPANKHSVWFAWVRPLLRKRYLGLVDLWALPEERGVEWADARLRHALAAGGPRAGRLPRALRAAFWRPMAAAALCKLCADLLRYALPLLLSALLSRLRDPHAEGAPAYALALCLPACTLVQAMLVNQYFWHVLHLGILIRASLVAAVYRRVLTTRTCDAVDAGHVANLAASDCSRIYTAAGVINMAWSAPLQLALALAMLARLLGAATLAGLGAMLLLWPAQLCVSRALAALRARCAAATDVRLRRLEHAISAHRAVKLQRWEGLCEHEVGAARAGEMRTLRREAAIRGVSVFLVTLAPTAVSVATFSARAALGAPPDPATVFAALVLFNGLRAPLSALPDLFSALAHAHVALVRIGAFLDRPDAEPTEIGAEMGAEMGAEKRDAYAPPSDGPALQMSGVALAWRVPPPRSAPPPPPYAAVFRGAGFVALPRALGLCSAGGDGAGAPLISADADAEPTAGGDALGAVDLRLMRGTLTLVVGAMGSGKSSLLLGALGQLHVCAGTISRTPRAAYVGQRPWLMRGSVRDNILFGKPLEADRYARVLDACALGPDIAEWPDADGTPIAERGAAISGGQQARVALARALYAQPELCVIDDTLAALDPTTQRHVWSRAVRTELRGAAVLATTSVGVPTIAMEADEVIVMRDGRVVDRGPPAALAARTGGPFAEMLAEAIADEVPAAPGTPTRPTARRVPTKPVADAEASPPRICTADLRVLPSLVDAAAAESASPDGARAAAGVSAGVSATPPPVSAAAAERRSSGARPWRERAIGEAEATWAAERTRGQRVSLSIYTEYVRRFGCGGAAFVGAASLFGLAQAALVLSDCWLARWSSLPPRLQADLPANLRVLGGLAALAALLVGAQASTWPLLSLRASQQLHSAALSSVIGSPMSFYYSMPAGRILTRFAKDQDVVDVALPAMAAQALACAAALVASLVTIVAAAPLAAPAVGVVAVLFARVVRSYAPTAADSKRLASVMHGPVMAMLIESVDARGTVQVFGLGSPFTQQALALLEVSARAQTFNVALQRWLALQLELLGAAMLLAVALLAVTAHQLAPLGAAGLALTYCLTFTSLAKYLINYATRADAQMASVERLLAFGELDTETTREVGEARRGRPMGAPPDCAWPSRGEVRLVRYCVAPYVPDGRPPLAPISLSLSPGEHAALIGRSGSGKSTLLAGIARLLPTASGDLSIDARDARDVPLGMWRSAIRAIPQEVLLLAGSVAHNLDPSATAPRAALWEALRLAGLEPRVRALPHGIDTPLLGAERAEHDAEPCRVDLSSGERQLLALARLLVHRRDARLVLLDELAANVEEATSARIHAVLHEEFAHATLLAITHRLLPFVHLFARVIVLAGGQLVEDVRLTDAAALRQPGGHLADLFAQAPPRLQAHVRRMLALRRSRGLKAVRGLWESAHHMGAAPAAAPAAASIPMAIAAARRTGVLGTSPGQASRATTGIPRRGWRKRSFAARTLPWSALTPSEDSAAGSAVAAEGAEGALRASSLCSAPRPASAIPRLPPQPSDMRGLGRLASRAYESTVAHAAPDRAADASRACAFAARELPWSASSAMR